MKYQLRVPYSLAIEVENQTDGKVDMITGELRTVRCGCPACDNGVQAGHFACSMPSTKALEAEAEGVIIRAYDNGTWRWFVV